MVVRISRLSRKPANPSWNEIFPTLQALAQSRFTGHMAKIVLLQREKP
jgi:hypothetical protein